MEDLPENPVFVLLFIIIKGAQQTTEILFLSREHKIHIFEQTCNLPFII